MLLTAVVDHLNDHTEFILVSIRDSLRCSNSGLMEIQTKAGVIRFSTVPPNQYMAGNVIWCEIGSFKRFLKNLVQMLKEEIDNTEYGQGLTEAQTQLHSLGLEIQRQRPEIYTWPPLQATEIGNLPFPMACPVPRMTWQYLVTLAQRNDWKARPDSESNTDA